MVDWTIHRLESFQEMTTIEDLQRLVWPGSETDVIPAHLLLAVVHNGGLGLGAYKGETLVGVSFAFPGFYSKPGGIGLKLHSHILGVHPGWEGKGVGYSLKRAQWQMAISQGLELVTWTYDPLLSRNAHLNISRLGSVCNTYLRSEYGDMRDALNSGLPSDRFQVDWWLKTGRVEHRMSQLAIPTVDVDQYRSSGAIIIKAASGREAVPYPPMKLPTLSGPLLLVEIPADFPSLKSSFMTIASDWRMVTRDLFEQAFKAGYHVSNFIHEKERSYYVLSAHSI